MLPCTEPMTRVNRLVSRLQPTPFPVRTRAEATEFLRRPTSRRPVCHPVEHPAVAGHRFHPAPGFQVHGLQARPQFGRQGPALARR